MNDFQRPTSNNAGWLRSGPASSSFAYGNAPAGDDVYYYIGKRLKLEGETENMGV